MHRLVERRLRGVGGGVLALLPELLLPLPLGLLLALLLRLQRLHAHVARLVDELAQLDAHHLGEAERRLVHVVLVDAHELKGVVVGLVDIDHHEVVVDHLDVRIAQLDHRRVVLVEGTLVESPLPPHRQRQAELPEELGEQQRVVVGTQPARARLHLELPVLVP